jgi:hypothetical protein
LLPRPVFKTAPIAWDVRLLRAHPSDKTIAAHEIGSRHPRVLR